MKSEDEKKDYSKIHLQKLAKKILDGSASEEEKLFLDEYYNFFDSENNEPLNLGDIERVAIQEEIKIKLQENLQYTKVRRIQGFAPQRVAAVIVLLIAASIGLFEIIRRTKDKDIGEISKTQEQAIVHGSNKAVLTLSNGTEVSLNKNTRGVLAKQDGLEISITANGEILYSKLEESLEANDGAFNEIKTPRGGIFQVILPDGSKVWLNSSTTLRYPLAFSKTERKVELQGEAYFEVAHNEHAPFHVICEKHIVEVLGTHFNVNSYSDENHATTTLVSGRVKINGLNSSKSQILTPGQQAIVTSSTINVKNVDASNSIAWKNNLFQFDNENIDVIMRKIARWYDVEIEYRGDLKGLRFGGSVSRFEDIQKVLRKLELTNTIHFKINGRRIIVMK